LRNGFEGWYWFGPVKAQAMATDLLDRERTILKLLSEQGFLSVSHLSRELGVSEVTVRSNLKELEERGLLSRSRGGAQLALHQGIAERQQQRIEEKTRIARAAAEAVQDGDTILIEAGTTTALIARYLVGKRDVHVVTNSTLVFSYGRLNPELQLTLTGGEFRRETESLVGPVALRTLEGINVRLAFVGTDGFSLEKGMTTHLFEGAEIVKAMHRCARETFLVADSSKHGKTGFVNVLPLSEIDVLVTDSELDEAAVRALREASVECRLV
jgi:DeoR family galactitol utilization operon repressor